MELVERESRDEIMLWQVFVFSIRLEEHWFVMATPILHVERYVVLSAAEIFPMLNAMSKGTLEKKSSAKCVATDVNSDVSIDASSRSLVVLVISNFSEHCMLNCSYE